MATEKTMPATIIGLFLATIIGLFLAAIIGFFAVFATEYVELQPAKVAAVTGIAAGSLSKESICIALEGNKANANDGHS